MQRTLTVRFWIEAAMAGLTGLLLAVTLAWPEWIEAVFGIDPDGRSGALELAIPLVLGVATAAFALRVRLAWRRAALAR